MHPIDSELSNAEIERLQTRVQRLAEEKAYLQLIVRLIEQLNPRPGLQDMIDGMLHSIMKSIGGTDIKLWYWVDQEVRYASFLGEKRAASGIDDPLAARVVRERAFIEQRGDPGEALLLRGALPDSWIWCFPLLVEPDLIGVIKLENIFINSRSLRNYLPIFFSHAALLLGNEIRNHQRRQALTALREKTEELDNYFNSALDLFCIVDTHGYFHKLNPAWHDALGYELADLEGHRFIDFVHPDDQPATLAVLRAVIDPHAVVNAVNRYRHQNGSWRWIEWRSQRRGNLIFAAARDITETKRADDAQRLAASVFANSQEGILITDANNRLIEVNEAFCRITGYARHEVIGRDPKLLSSGRQDAAFYETLWRTIKERGSWRGEIWNRRKSGEEYPQMLSIDAVPDETGQIQHYVGAFSDISQIKEHEAELERIAHYDTLTGLPNRRLLADRLYQELARTRRRGYKLALCYLDLDGFKSINDRLGHEAGDQLLTEIGQRLKNALRVGDTVARLGGDEFVLLLCDLADDQECLPVLERVLRVVALPMTLKDQQVAVSASIGATLFPRDDSDSDQLMRHADQAMYQAKAAGKSRFYLFEPGLEGPEPI
ncbi:MAG: diguanylate cyclase [Candidatus Competibacter sp.]|nr:diguanylate cyclase [Candidatus Competibacteraceae bacterium]